MTKLNEPAFTRFHQLYYPRLLRYFIVITGGDIEMAKDVVQSTFIRVVKKIRVFDSEP